MRVVVVGAGIGGLTFAIAARRRGHQVTVIDKRPNFPEEGAGIILGPNVMEALRELELVEPIAAVARPIEQMCITDHTGRPLASSRYTAPRFSIPAQAVHRSRLHQVLREAFDGELRVGSEVTGVEGSDRPAVWMGSEVLRADQIVGADGIHSRVREVLHPGFVPRYSGVTCWRFVVDSQWTEQATEMWGFGKRVGVVPLGLGQTYLFLTLNAPRHAPAPFHNLEGFRALWSGFGPPAKQGLEALDDFSKLLHNDLEDGIPDRWCAPGLVLLGDAAHAVTPNLGQGAGLAVEDACCLASLLGTPDALSRYESLRRPRATWIRDRSFSMGRVGQLDSPWLCRLRNKIVTWTPSSVNAAVLKRIVNDMPGVPLRES